MVRWLLKNRTKEKMYHIEQIDIDGFWNKNTSEIPLDEFANILIGRNGSGKTTLLRFISAVLSPDLEELSKLEFKNITVYLRNEESTRTIKVEKQKGKSRRFIKIKYKIWNRAFELTLDSLEREPVYYSSNPSERRLRHTLSQLVNIVNLSVHRLSYESVRDYQIGLHRQTVRPLIDIRLENLMKKLTAYQLGLAEEANKVSQKFQADVLLSLLFSNEFDRVHLNVDESDIPGIGRFLQNAYDDLIHVDKKIQKRIDEHMDAIKESINSISKWQKDETNLNVESLIPMPLYFRTKHIIELSKESQEEKNKIFSKFNRFVDLIASFMPNKRINIYNNDNVIFERDDIQLSPFSLSSGEKQILVLLIEALLQSKTSGIMIIDEPELSLHIEWQRKIVKAIRDLNPKSQLIIATHSPEIAGSSPTHVVQMEKLIDA